MITILRLLLVPSSNKLQEDLGSFLELLAVDPNSVVLAVRLNVFNDIYL